MASAMDSGHQPGNVCPPCDPVTYAQIYAYWLTLPRAEQEAQVESLLHLGQGMDDAGLPVFYDVLAAAHPVISAELERQKTEAAAYSELEATIAEEEMRDARAQAAGWRALSRAGVVAP